MNPETRILKEDHWKFHKVDTLQVDNWVFCYSFCKPWDTIKPSLDNGIRIYNCVSNQAWISMEEL